MNEKDLDTIQDDPDENSRFAQCQTLLKNISNEITKNGILSQIDSFSLQLKFFISGKEQFQTLLAGVFGIVCYVVIAIVVYQIAWPSKIDSKIKYFSYFVDTGESGVNIFAYVDEPISFLIVPLAMDVPQEFGITFFYVKTGQVPIQLQLDTNCKYGNYCLTPRVNTAINLQIYGDRNDIKNASITAQISWCSQSLVPSCPEPGNYYFSFSIQNTHKEKQKKLVVYNQSYQVVASTFGYNQMFSFQFQVIKQQYVSNNKVFGYLSNVLPQTLDMYKINSLPLNTYYSYDLFQPLSKNIQNNNNFKGIFNANFAYKGKSTLYTQQFVDLSIPLIFLFALIDPITFLLNHLILKRYNKNCRDLYIANKLFYVEDPIHDQKYNFQQGYQVFIVCLLHRHPFMKVFCWGIGLFGKNLMDILPNKYIYTMYMINKGAEVLYDNEFFGTLGQLTTLEDSPLKKIYFDQQDLDEDKNTEQQQLQINYFPQNILYHNAFIRFCRDNECYSIKRRNKIYGILLDNKYSTNLKDDLHRVFKGYIRNMQNLKNKGLFNQQNDYFIPVSLRQKQKENQSSYQLQLSKIKGK